MSHFSFDLVYSVGRRSAMFWLRRFADGFGYRPEWDGFKNHCRAMKYWLDVNLISSSCSCRRCWRNLDDDFKACATDGRETHDACKNRGQKCDQIGGKLHHYLEISHAMKKRCAHFGSRVWIGGVGETGRLCLNCLWTHFFFIRWDPPRFGTHSGAMLIE